MVSVPGERPGDNAPPWFTTLPNEPVPASVPPGFTLTVPVLKSDPVTDSVTAVLELFSTVGPFARLPPKLFSPLTVTLLPLRRSRGRIFALAPVLPLIVTALGVVEFNAPALFNCTVPPLIVKPPVKVL